MYDSYMVMECSWERYIAEDEDTMMSSFSAPKVIKCFIYGKNLFIRENTNCATVSAKAYVVVDNVKVGDKIDGQLVKSVYNIPEFDGSFPAFECLTWNS